jgi:hypothetical protein
MIIKGTDLPFKKYPVLPEVDHDASIFALKEEVYVTEKLIGKQIRIRVTEQGLILGDKDETISNPDDYDLSAIEAVSDRILEYFMPFVKEGKDVIIFGVIIDDEFVVFDVYMNSFQDYETVMNFAELVEIPYAKLVYYGYLDKDKFAEFIVDYDVLVIKSYTHFDFDGRPLFVQVVNKTPTVHKIFVNKDGQAVL